MNFAFISLATWMACEVVLQAEYKYDKGLCALRPFFGPRLRTTYEIYGNKSISLHDFIRPIFLVFHFSSNLNQV